MVARSPSSCSSTDFLRARGWMPCETCGAGGIAEQDDVARGRAHRERVGERQCPASSITSVSTAPAERFVGEEPRRTREEQDIRVRGRERSNVRLVVIDPSCRKLRVAVRGLLEAAEAQALLPRRRLDLPQEVVDALWLVAATPTRRLRRISSVMPRAVHVLPVPGGPGRRGSSRPATPRAGAARRCPSSCTAHRARRPCRRGGVRSQDVAERA